MKKISVIISVIIVLWACNDGSNGKTNSRDSVQPQSGNGQDNKRDTAMYQRMPLKTSDSTPK